MTLINVVLRGQSNAMLFKNSAIRELDLAVEKYLGFDGQTNNINLVADVAPWRTIGNYTINDGTGFITAIDEAAYPDYRTNWIAPKNGDWLNQGWENLALETGFLNRLEQLKAQQANSPASATAILWLHSEYDSSSSTLTAEQWLSGVHYDAKQVRAIFGGDPAYTPYLFVNALPYAPGKPSTNQAIKQGMETLAIEPAFNGSIAAQPYDLNMDGDKAGAYGGNHISPSDARYLVDRLARSIAQEFASFRTGAAVSFDSTGNIADQGPQVVNAVVFTSNVKQLTIEVKHDAATGFKALNSVASAGMGWSLRGEVSGTVISPISAEITDNTHITLTFATDISGAASSGDKLYYAYGYGRLGGSGLPGQGNAIYDDQGLPIWASAYGVSLTTTQAIDNPPIVVGNGSPDQFVIEDTAFTFDASKAFSDPGDTLSYSFASSDGSPVPKWLNFDKVTGLFSGTPWDKAAGQLTITVIARDKAGSSASDTFILNIADNRGEVWNGGSRNERKTGTSGQDTLDGGAGADVINGGAGSDWIVASAGDDTFTGATGWDTFEFRLGSGRDVITDFRVGEDRIYLPKDIPSFSIQNVQEINIDKRSGADATLVTFSDGSTVQLNKVLGLGDLSTATNKLTILDWAM